MRLADSQALSAEMPSETLSAANKNSQFAPNPAQDFDFRVE
jgi:hypothetical protein